MLDPTPTECHGWTNSCHRSLDPGGAGSRAPPWRAPPASRPRQASSETSRRPRPTHVAGRRRNRSTKPSPAEPIESVSSSTGPDSRALPLPLVTATPDPAAPTAASKPCRRWVPVDASNGRTDDHGSVTGWDRRRRALSTRSGRATTEAQAPISSAASTGAFPTSSAAARTSEPTVSLR